MEILSFIMQILYISSIIISIFSLICKFTEGLYHTFAKKLAIVAVISMLLGHILLIIKYILI